MQDAFRKSVAVTLLHLHQQDASVTVQFLLEVERVLLPAKIHCSPPPSLVSKP
jgi:hypothetical protein